MTAPVDLGAFLSGFLIEAEEHLSSARSNLLLIEDGLRRGEPRPGAVRELFRSLHTIKGLSAMVGVEPIVEISHAMETLLRAADGGRGPLTAAALTLLSRGTSAIDERVQALARGQTPMPVPPSLREALSARIEVSDDRDSSPGDLLAGLEPELAVKFTRAERQQCHVSLRAGRRVLRVDFTPSPARADGLDITRVRERMAQIAEIVRVFPRSVPRDERAPGGLSFCLIVSTTAEDAAVAEAAGTAPGEVLTVAMPPEASEGALLPEPEPESAPTRGAHVRVEVSRIDDSFEDLAALIVSRFKLARAAAALGAQGVDVRELDSLLSEHGRKLRDLRASVLRLRMVTVDSLLDRVPLMLRGLERESGKSVRLEMKLGNAELDKAVADRVFPAIVHLVRNAVDHGLESPEARVRAGKSAEGLVRITCSERSSGQLEIVVEDDGRGMDREGVAKRAGRVPKDDGELLELITRPGISTAPRVTTTSGRGVGMEIVKRIVVTDLGGELRLDTSAAVGTRFTLRIPLTISIVEAIAFEVGGQRFVTPVGSVEEVMEIEPGRIVDVPQVRASGFAARLLRRRDVTLPLFALGAVFGLPPPAALATVAPKALVVRRQERQFAFEVETMLGQQEVVVRPLEDPLVRVPGVSGSTDLGDGRPTLVVDLIALCGHVAPSELRA